MKAVRLVLVTLLTLAISCGGSKDSTAPALISTTGTWRGTFVPSSGPSTTLTFTLAENNGSVTGAGAMTFDSTTIAFTSNGAYVAPNVALTLINPFFQSIAFTATVSDKAMAGRLNGSGYNNEPILLVRQ